MKKTNTQQLIDLTNRINELEVIISEKDIKIKQLEKDLSISNSTKNTWYEASQSKDKEMELLHSVLDNLPESLPRRNEETYSENPLSIRFAVWFARKK